LHVLISVMGMPWSRYPEGLKLSALLDEDVGQYSRWSRVSYVIDDYSQRSLTTVPVLYNYIASRYRAPPEKTVVIVQDTAVVKVSGISGDYSSLLSVVEEVYREFLEDQGVGKGLEVFVAPGVGKFKNMLLSRGKEVPIVVDVCGSLADFQQVVVLQLAQTLLKIVDGISVGEELVAHLDLSHGVNYVPVLTRAILLELLSIVASYSTAKSVVMRVYNSEPVMRDVPKDFYTIHVVEEVRLKSDGKYSSPPLLEGVEGRVRLFIANRVCCPREQRSTVGKAASKASEELAKELGLNPVDMVNAFAGSLLNGLPLLALEAMPSVSLERFVSSVLELYKQFVKVSRTEQDQQIKIRVVKSVELTEQVKALAKILLAKELVSRLIREGYDYEHGVKLDTIGKATELLYSWSERLKITISYDYGWIRNKIEEKLQGNVLWTRLVDVIEPEKSDKCAEELKHVNERNFERNFLQHSGLQDCVTEVMAEDKRVYRIRYAKSVVEDLELRKKIYEFASKGLVKVC